MHKTAILLCSLLFATACANTTPAPRLIHPEKSPVAAAAKATPTTALSNDNLSRLPNPFKSKTDEEMFWKVMNGEVDAKSIAMTDELQIALILRIMLSSLTPEQMRMQVTQMLVCRTPIYYPSEEDLHQMSEDLVSGDFPRRWHSLHFLFESSIKTTNLVRYVLGDIARMKDFALKDAKAKAEAPPEQTAPSADPATPATPAKKPPAKHKK